MRKKNRDSVGGVFWQDEEYRKKPRRRVRVWAAGLLLFLFVIVSTAAAVLIINEFTLTMEVFQPEDQVIEYGQDFFDAGAKASFRGSLLYRNEQAVEVTVSGEVDTSTVGSYPLVYRAEYVLDYFLGKLSFSESHTRNIQVVDTQPPQISLTIAESETVFGEPYVEDGFTAWDDYDGDLTDCVQRQEQGDTVCYTVTDSSGNTTTVYREIQYCDLVPPVLALLGEPELFVDQWSDFQDPGATAQDNRDGDITHLIGVEGAVDTSVPGMHTLVYTVSDSYGNTVSATRVVVVGENLPMPDMPVGDYQIPIEPEGKVIYLTFDDGPSDYTPRLLYTLERYNVKATFFVVETGCMQMLTRIADGGHTVAMHSASHEYGKIYADKYAYFNDLYDIQNMILERTGKLSTILRFPGGSSNSVSKAYSKGIMTELTQMVKDMGYRYFDWNVDSRDATVAHTKEEVVSNVIGGIKRHDVSIVLMHDIFEYSVDAVPEIIQWALRNGYTFATLDSAGPVCEQPLKN